MIVPELYVSTGEAAGIVQVHESTIKRWCDAGDLAVTLTAGGHRRIALSSLLSWADRRGLESYLLDFGDDAETVYLASTEAQGADFHRATSLFFRATRERRAAYAAQLLWTLLGRGIALPEVLDRVVAPALRRVGAEWCEGSMQVGDEHMMSAVISDVLRDLRSRVDQQRRSPGVGRAVVGALAGNGHEFGAMMVRMVLEARGWDVVYLGASVPEHDLADQQRRTESGLVCISITAPQIWSDAHRACRFLADRYDSAHSYRLALGGAPLGTPGSDRLPERPFDACEAFSSLSDFSNWV